MRIEGALHFAERFIQRVAEHLAHEGAAHQSVAVFARERPAEFEHQIGNVVGDALEPAHPLVGLHVDDRTNVKAADGSMRINSGRGVVAANHFQKPAYERAQFLGRHRGVLYEGNRFVVVLHRGREPQSGFTQAPDAGLRRQVRLGVVMVAELPSPQIFLQRLHARRQIFFLIGVHFDAQRRARIARNVGVADPVEHGVLASEIEDGFIHHFHRRRFMFEDHRGGGKRFQQLLEADHHHCLELRQRHQVDLRFEDHAQRALRAHHDPGQIHGLVLIDKFIQIVAGDAAQNFGIAAVDLSGVFPGESQHRAVAGGFERIARRHFTPRHFAKVHDAAVPKQDSLLQNVIDGLPVKHAARAAGIIGHHAA